MTNDRWSMRLAGLCRDCKHWKPDSDEQGQCEMARRRTGKPVHPDSKMHARDDDNWFAVLDTRADFGCVMWEPATKETA